MRLLTVGIALALATACFADTVRMKDGRTIQGTYLGGSARQVRMEVRDQIQTLDVSDIDRIEFGGNFAPAPPPPPPPPPPQAENRPVLRPEPPPAAPAPPYSAQSGSITLPAGPHIAGRMID